MSIEEKVQERIEMWARDKGVKLNEMISGTSLQGLFDKALTTTSFNMSDDYSPNHIAQACCYFLYKKFYNQVHKGEKAEKTIVFDNTTVSLKAQDVDKQEVAKKAKTLVRANVTVNTNNVNPDIFQSELVNYFACGFFPISFLNKLFVFTDVDGQTLRVAMKGPKGNKEIYFVQKLESTYDFTPVA